MRPISNSTITINTFSVIFKGRVSDLLIPTSASSVVAPTVTSYIVMKTIIKTTIINRYTQQSSMVTWVIGVIVDSLGHLSTSSININSFLHITRGSVSGVF